MNSKQKMIWDLLGVYLSNILLSGILMYIVTIIMFMLIKLDVGVYKSITISIITMVIMYNDIKTKCNEKLSAISVFKISIFSALVWLVSFKIISINTYCILLIIYCIVHLNVAYDTYFNKIFTVDHKVNVVCDIGASMLGIITGVIYVINNGSFMLILMIYYAYLGLYRRYIK